MEVGAASPRFAPCEMGVYFVIIEEELAVRPSYGVVVLGDGTRHRITNTDGLWSWVIELAAEIRAARVAVDQPIPSMRRRANAGPAANGRIAGKRGG